VTFDGRTLWPGGRQAYCPSSPDYRAAAARLVERLAARYAEHPALAMWHANNEYGCHVARCYCDTSAAAFRAWLRERYETVEALNEAWGTAFWSQHYWSWHEINPPRQAPNFINPTQQLDFARFSSDELLACFRAERDILRRLTPDVPVTTNFMTPAFKPLDYFKWAREEDLVSTDHYLRPAEGDPNLDVALSADLARGLGGGAPWLLMEHSTSAVNWQRRNLAKRPGQMRRNSLAHVARGADGTLFFQWRASRRGAEKFHSGMVPHAGEDSRVWREVVALGRDLERLAPVRGSRVVADAAMLWCYESWWAVEQDSHPSADVTYLDRVRAFHAALWRAGVTVDVVHPDQEWSGYQLILIPSLYLVSDATAEALERYVTMGGHVVVSYFSGIVDTDDAIRLGGYPGAFRTLLGVRTEEFAPLAEGETVRLDDGSSASLWTEDLRLEGAEAIASYADGPMAGRPAVTRRALGDGVAWYVATRLDPGPLLSRVCGEAGVEPVLPGLPEGVEAVRRRGAGGDFVFVLNHTGAPVRVDGPDLLGGDGTVPPGGVAVVKG
jgi:beta-galactosidase